MPTADRPKRAASPFNFALLWTLALVVFLSDQVSKVWITEFSGLIRGLYPPFGGFVIVPDYLNIVYSVNHGAAWGILEGYGWLLIALALCVLAAFWFFRHSLQLEFRINQICFGLIMGGIAGNTLDRFLHGHVIDFVDVNLQFYRWPTFNIADSALVVGTILYVFIQFFSEEKK